MLKKKSFVLLGGLSVLILVGAWAVENQKSMSEPAAVKPADFDSTNPTDYPQPNVVVLDIIGIARIGKVYMVEGIENTTNANFNATTDTWELGNNAQTIYSRLVLHGVFDKLMRDWRDEVISGKATKREIRVDLMNSANKRVLRVHFLNAFPVKFSVPPLSIDGSTRYMERMEFVYDSFTIANS